MKEKFDILLSSHSVGLLAKELNSVDKQSLFEHIIQPDNLPKFLKNIFDLCNLLASFPENKEKLINILPDYFTKIVTCGFDIERLSLWCPEGQELLFKFIADPKSAINVSISPEYIKKFTHLYPIYQKNLYQYLTFSVSFKKIMNSIYNVRMMIETFPSFKDELFKLMIKNNILDQLINKPSDLKKLQEIFPHLKFLTTISLDEENYTTVEKWGEKKSKEIKNKYLELTNQPYSRGAGKGFFYELNLPAEVGAHIGSFLDRKTAVQLTMSRKLALQTAQEEENAASTSLIS
jgi:hypothetical protein